MVIGLQKLIDKGFADVVVIDGKNYYSITPAGEKELKKIKKKKVMVDE